MQDIIHGLESVMPVGSHYKNKRRNLLAVIRSKIVIVLAASTLLGACGKGGQAPDQPQGDMALPVSIKIDFTVYWRSLSH
jgi:hypothetical protein